MRADMIQESRHPDAARSGQADDNAAWSREAFEAKLRERGKSYHIHHPFNVMLNTGKATPEQVRGWVANRFYYQIAIPIKDAYHKNCIECHKQSSAKGVKAPTKCNDCHKKQ